MNRGWFSREASEKHSGLRETAALAVLLGLLLPLAHAQPAQQPPVPQQPPRTHRAIPDDNLAYPVLITIGNSTGSGFYVSTADTTYLVTATHVLFAIGTATPPPLFASTFTLLSYSPDPADATPNRVIVDTRVLGVGNIMRHPTADVTVIRLFTHPTPNTVSEVAGVTIAQSAARGFLGVSMETIARMNEILVGNEVILFGYPTSLGLQVLPQLDRERPLLRKGIVAGINTTLRSIILDCPVYFGNSGGPVIEIDTEDVFRKHFRVIGVVDQYVPYADGGRTFSIMANSGYSVIVPMDFVLELIH